MHLIVLENHVTTLRGGQELNLIEICEALVDRGHQVSLLYLQAGDLLKRYETLCDRVIQISAYGFDWRSLRSTLRFLPSLLQVWQIPIEPDSVIFCNDYHFSLFAAMLSYLRDLPYVCYLQLPPLNLNRQRKFGLTQADRFIAVSEQTKQEWIEFGLFPDRISVVYNGINLDKFKPANDFQAVRQAWNISESTRLISYIGRLDREKGLETLIEATAILIAQGANVQTIIAGKSLIQSCDYAQSLMQLAEKLKVGDRVQFVGHLADPVSLYQASDISVLPSVWEEPCSRGLFESLACGVPKIASRIGGNPEILTGEFESGLFTPNDPKDLAHRIMQIMNWRQTDPNLGDRCRQHVMNYFSDQKMVDGIEKVLAECSL